MKISVSILGEKDNYEVAVEKLNNTSSDYLHLDIMDNTFTNTSSFNYDDSIKINNLNKKKLDVHIMSDRLDEVIDEYIKLNPDIISFHFEVVDDLKKYINKIKKYNIKVGVAINPDTNVSEIYPFLEDIDIVLVMGVYAGKGGQKYIENTTEKLKSLRKIQKNYKYQIEVDGGINNEIIKDIKDYVDIVVSGNYITSSDNYEEKIKSLK